MTKPNKTKAKTPKKQTGRKCSICTHERVKEINSLVNAGVSFRKISLNFGMSDVSVHRHVQNHLNLEIQALIKQKKIENAIDHYQEITEQLEFAKELRLAAREYLSDPETGNLVLIPRADEFQVIYEDNRDLNDNGSPKKKRDDLQVLLKRAEDGGVTVVKAVAKHVDIRQFALHAIQTVDLVLDKIAKKEGLYQKSKENQELLEVTANNIFRAAQAFPGADLDTLIKTAAEDAKINEKVLSAKVYALVTQQLETVQ